ncbi:hypothetical protein [Candidatus Nitrosocosmicus arcticus]|uniref:hypothetical protein n=1 Tax=Candidatus Nitrosocosmicus arcticus TaxID=2035267 RepID=UPI0011A032FE|nr:hypothetical protein [Candidatus Nitrosocosmicus arcticus]
MTLTLQALFLRYKHFTQLEATITLLTIHAKAITMYVGPRWHHQTSVYTFDFIPGWENNLLMTTLKDGKIFLINLNDNGAALESNPVELFHCENRYCDVAFSHSINAIMKR